MGDDPNERQHRSLMDKLDDLMARVTRLEALYESRWAEILNRIKRLEGILICTAAATIMLLLSIITT